MMLVERMPFPLVSPVSTTCQRTNNAVINRVIGWGMLLLLSTAQAQTQFEWHDASGNVRNLADLTEILREHRQWIESQGKAGTLADLSGANLTGANLGGANLGFANLGFANL